MVPVSDVHCAIYIYDSIIIVYHDRNFILSYDIKYLASYVYCDCQMP